MYIILVYGPCVHMKVNLVNAINQITSEMGFGKMLWLRAGVHCKATSPHGVTTQKTTSTEVCLRHRVQIGCGPTQTPINNGISFSGGKAAGAPSWTLADVKASRPQAACSCVFINFRSTTVDRYARNLTSTQLNVVMARCLSTEAETPFLPFYTSLENTFAQISVISERIHAIRIQYCPHSKVIWRKLGHNLAS
jgi:hypothetical protein